MNFGLAFELIFKTWKGFNLEFKQQATPPFKIIVMMMATDSGDLFI
jgi:hypothetical protein